MCEKKRRDSAGRKPPLPFETIEQAWNLTAQHRLPPDMPSQVRTLLRDMFFMGAGAFFDVLMHWMDSGEEPTDSDMRRMSRLYSELQDFMSKSQAEAMKRGAPPGNKH